jgi:hypothetical protein
MSGLASFTRAGMKRIASDIHATWESARLRA